jgi:hypothetical protein
VTPTSQNFRYPYGNEKILDGDIPWRTAPIVAHLIGTHDYHPDTYPPDHAGRALHARLSRHFWHFGRIEPSTLGVADADDVTWGTVAARTNRGDAVLLALSTGVRADDVLIAFFGTVIGVPVYPDGSDITCHWDQGANKVFIL